MGTTGEVGWIYLYLFNRKSLAPFERERKERLNRRGTLSSRKAIELPLPREFRTIMPIALMYGVARMYQMVEFFLQLRHLDASAFVQVSWSVYFPHI